jgi:hypothetical protein
VDGRKELTDRQLSAISHLIAAPSIEQGCKRARVSGAGAVYVCEGEKKTLVAHQAGMNAAGIGGLWNWLTNGEPIDDLKLIEWDDRDVVIVPDSDVFQRQLLSVTAPRAMSEPLSSPFDLFLMSAGRL